MGGFARAGSVLIAVAVTVGLSAPPSRAAGTSGGTATIVDPGSGEALRSGGSQTEWMLTLPKPPKSNCSGDSAVDAHFVYTYLVSKAVAPGDVTFDPEFGVEPRPGQVALPLIDSFGRVYISRNTAPETGQVLPGTAFTFDRLSLDGSKGARLEPGDYNVGIGCWDARQRSLDRYWNATITFREDGRDPNGLSWTASPTLGGSTQSSPPWRYVLLAAAVAGGVLAFRRTRSRSAAK